MLNKLCSLVQAFLLVITTCQSHYLNQWAVNIEGGESVAREVAKDHGFVYLGEIMPDYYKFQHPRIMKRSLEANDYHHSSLMSNEKVLWAEQQIVKKRKKRDISNMGAFNDPYWPNMWYLNREYDNNMNVLGAYRKYNITGQGIHVTILDDGIEKDHPDLSANYDPKSSYDINDGDADPQPHYDISDENKHGTRCAGEVAAVANNNFCGVGVAYRAGIGGVRMLDGDVTDSVEAQALSLNKDHIDIYSASWGPEDNGQALDGPGTLARKAIFDGIVSGRNGLGNIFVWASGNGGSKGDSCACDGYTNSIYTLSVSSVSEHGTVPWYSEPCSSTMASTYSSGANGAEKSIITTDLHHRCTTEHTGTSASAPLAAGLCALALEANTHLTWRDMQYIVFLTARSANLIADDWVVNGVGRKVSHHYGYGLMDGTAMVEVARNWTPLSEHHRCATQSSSQLVNLTIPSGQSESSVIISNGCQGTGDAVQYLEHVECIVTLRANRRGEVQLFLVSPSGTKSQLLPKREADSSHEGFRNWSFMTTHNWAENPNGSWTLIVTNKETSSNLREWSLVLYGVDREPEIYKRYLPSSTAAKPEADVNTKADDNKNSNDAGSRSQDGVKQFVGQNSGANNLTNIKSIETRMAKDAAAASKNKTCAKELYLLKNACLSQCPQGYYPSENDHKCLPCSWECKICRNADGCTVSMEASDQTKWKSATFAFIVLLAIILSASVLLLFVFITRRRRKNLSSLQDSLFSGENDKNNHNRLIFHGGPLKNSEIHVPSLECSDRNSAKAPLLNNEESCSDDEIDLLTANDIKRNYQRFDSNNVQPNTFSLP